MLTVYLVDDEALALRRLERMLAATQRVRVVGRATDPLEREAWLTFVIVGGGPTGVELAGAIGEIANDTLRHEFDTIRPEESRILLLDGGERLLSTYPPASSAAAQSQSRVPSCSRRRAGSPRNPYRRPSIPGCFLQLAMRARDSGRSSGSAPMIAKLPG